MKNFTAIDFESATYDHFACQVGIVVVENGIITERVSHLIQPPANRYDSGPKRVHGIGPRVTKDSPTFDEVWEQIKQYLDNTTVVAHNVAFDKTVLEKNLAVYGLDIPKIRYVCTCELYKRTSLADLCQAFDIPLSDHHNALFDAECCAQFYLKYIDGQKPDYSKVKKINKTKKFVSSTFETKDFDRSLLVKDLGNADPNNPFYDKSIVITGDFTQNRADIAKCLQSLGADVNTAISQKTHFVAIGENPGPKKIEKIEMLIADGVDIKKIYQDDIDRLLAK